MKVYRYILLDMCIVEIQYLSAIPNSNQIWHVRSLIRRRKWLILTLSTYSQVLSYNSQWVKVDHCLPQHTSILVHSIFAKIIGNFSVDIETCHVSVRDPSISLPFYKGKYKENFTSIYLHSYRSDFDLDSK